MSNRKRDLRRISRTVTLLSVVAFGTLMSLAVARYSGGSYFDPKARGHDFFRNFWCDLLRDVGHDGRPSGSPLFAELALWALGVGLIAFFQTLSGYARSPRSKLAIRALGFFGVLGLAAVALTPSHRFPTLHGVLVLSAGPAGLLAAAIGIASALVSRALPWPAAVSNVACVAFGAWNAGQYFAEFALGAASSPLLPAVQKLATLSLLAALVSTPPARERA